MNLKKICAILIAIATMSGAMVSVFAEDADDTEPQEPAVEQTLQGTEAETEVGTETEVKTETEAKTESEEKQIKVLSPLEVYSCRPALEQQPLYKQHEEIFARLGLEFESKEKSTAITRMDFAKMLVVLKNENPNLSSYRANVVFDDVDKGNKDGGYANYAYDKGLMLAKEANNFMPDSNVTGEDVAYAFVKLLGYDEFYQIDSSNISAYYSKAIELKLLSGVKKESLSKGLDYEDCMIAFYNLMNSPVIEYGFDGLTYTCRISDELYMTANFDLEYETGIMYSNGITSISQNASKSNIVIGTQTYEAGSFDVSSFIGKSVTAYYIDDDSRTLVDLIESKKNSVLRIYGSDIESYTDFTYNYVDEKGSSKEKKISKDINIVYNGAVATNDTVSSVNYEPEHGYIELIDNNSDNKYETLIIYDFEHYVIESINTKDEVIVSKYTTDKINYASDSYEYLGLFNEKGEVIDTEALLEGQSIAVCKSIDEKVISIYAYQKNVSGTVSGIARGSDEFTVAISDKLYIVPSSVTALFNNVSVETEVTLYLDLYGNVFYAVTSGNKSYVLGYLTRVFIDSDNEDKLNLRYYDTTTQTHITKVCADKLYLDDVRTASSVIYDALYNSTTQTTNYQPLRVMLNSKDEITKIDLADTTTNMLSKTTGNLQQFLCLRKSNGRMENLYVMSNGVAADYDGKNIRVETAVVEKETPIICVPANRLDESSYSIRKFSDFDGDVYMDLYKVTKEGMYPDFGIKYAGTGEPEESSTSGVNHLDGLKRVDPISVVEKVTMVLNANEEAVHQLTLITEGKREVLNVYDDQIALNPKTSTDLNPGPVRAGEVIKYCLNGNGDIWGIQKLFSVEDLMSKEGKFAPDTYDHALNDYRCTLYNAYYKDGNAVVLTTNDPRNLNINTISIPKEAVVLSVGAFKHVYYYDRKSKTFEAGDASRIDAYCNNHKSSKVVVRTRTGGNVDMYIYDAEAFN